MFKLLKKKKKKDEETEESSGEGEENTSDEVEENEPKKIEKTKSSGDIGLTKLSTDMDRVKASIESFGEVRKSLTERISHISEQIGELRAMILDRDRTIQKIELKSIKAADMVETVQPEKMMVEVQKVNAKFEALKANLEGNEAIMDRVLEELKETRRKLEFFRGVQEIVKLSEEIKKELIDIKKIEAGVGVNTDKVQTIYIELKKKFEDIESFGDNLQEIKVQVDQNFKDIDNMKTKMADVAQKEDLDNTLKKIQREVDFFKQSNKTSGMSRDIAQLRKLLDGTK
ncbi:hypothetical protein COU60_00025 [Candidatus Pacearchaeota archaeon CG10_big_fil_rev_8_21_14_0_10_34_76]|nr:MAG: hypothetical protein COU60_00025 [Candidatus Pacearchaeota archaeon CG10_big_fil_rev_8_21_14_0_10_34_76]